MNSAWSLEILRLVILLCSALLVGAVTQAWVVTLSVHFFLYIAWLFSQLITFERWISRGAHKSDAPDNTGVWQSMVQHLYRSQSSHKARKKQLASMANYYHAVMRALPDATVVVNKNQEIEWANKASQKLLGIKPSKDVGQRIENIFRVPDMDDFFTLNAKIKRIQVESPTAPEITLSIAVQEYDEGSYLIIAHDISHRIATQKLRKAFIANASHELRTPLTVISGYLEILSDDEELPPALEKVIKNTYEQANRMDNILDDLLVLSKLEEKRYAKSDGDEVDVKHLLDRLVADFRVSYSDTGHEFVVTAVPYHLRVVDSELYSVCQNLVSNAVKYSQAGSMIKIDWSVDEAGFGCLSVSDQGDGIPKEHINRLTERFYRVNSATKQISGTGLGLSIVKHILDNFDGYLEIQSAEGEGSTFKACFPSYRLIKN